ncbi:acyl-CoA-like ligand-binding transcription factor [Humibacter ginsenosidimutans]|uniref:TetR family transcriptional regulator n=1 Tax=Humibacter ginsenosidimutans TaxID=2599293 RepID=A0A5B8M3R6_9MICO|nr:TetR family transcriptional regulator [Humibacter ginsenosidimutans]QDZ14801.1 TetR family transcriptional regulator [Humibacter ginsenosidimutans]
MPNRTDDVPRPGLRERKKARTRASIQSHALRLFTEQGYDATTIDQIIDAAEVSESTFFRYFPTKESVVLFDDFDPAIIAAFEAQPPGTGPVAAMRAALREAMSGLTDEQREEQRERLALVVGVPVLRGALLDQLSQAMLLLTSAIADRVGRSADDYEVRTVAGAIIGCMFAVLAQLTDDPDGDMAELIDRSFSYLENGLDLEVAGATSAPPRSSR